jgi:hypothetical protein
LKVTRRTGWLVPGHRDIRVMPVWAPINYRSKLSISNRYRLSDR